jgi:hypothetical protein
MSKNIILVSIYHHHKLLDLIHQYLLNIHIPSSQTELCIVVVVVVVVVVVFIVRGTISEVEDYLIGLSNVETQFLPLPW